MDEIVLKGNIRMKQGKKIKKRWIVIGIILLLVLAGLGGLWFFLSGMKGKGTGIGNRDFGQPGTFSGGSTAYGVISIGVSQVDFEVEELNTPLVISKVNVSSGQDVEKGAVILELTEDSVLDAREELEQVLLETELAYRAGVIEYEQSLINAEYDRDAALLQSRYAKEVYQETLDGLTGKLENARTELADAREEIAEYHSYVDNDTYRSYFEVDKYQKIYDENLELLQSRMSEWGIDWPQVTGGTRPGETNQYVIVLSGLYKVLEENLKDLEKAESAYEEALSNAALELQTLELQLPELEQAVLDAQESYEADSLAAKVTYETSVNNGEYAEKNYEAAVEKAEADLDLLKDTYEDAKANLELFESTVGDCRLYAAKNGNILRVMVRQGQNISSGTSIFTYSNPEEMTVTISVDQSRIAEIQVGDTAYVEGTYKGVVSEINPISQAESYTDVTYDVIVSLSGNLKGLTSNENVVVTFGDDQSGSMNQQRPDKENPMSGFPEGMQPPEGMEFPEGMQPPEGMFPEGMERPQGGERPERGDRSRREGGVTDGQQ